MPLKVTLTPLIYNPVASAIPKLRKRKLLRWLQDLHQSTWKREILYGDISSKDEQLSIRQSLRKTINTNVAGGRKLKIHILLYRD
jgi:hypothetical protein